MEVQSLSPESIQDIGVLPTASTSSPPMVTPIPSSLIDGTFSATTNLSTTVLGAQVLSFSDEYFAFQPSDAHACCSQAWRLRSHWSLVRWLGDEKAQHKGVRLGRGQARLCGCSPRSRSRYCAF